MGISLLSVLLFALVTPLIINFTIFNDPGHTLYYSLIFLLLGVVIATDLWKDKLKNYFRIRAISVWLVIFLTIGASMIVAIGDRHKISSVYKTHDTVIQQEVAVRMLLTHKNPYKETYFGTPLEDFKFSQGQTNPALFHLVMEPFYLVSAVPFYFLETRTIGFFDGRISLYLLFLAILVGGFLFIKDKESKLLFLTLMAFNPMNLGFLLEGRSDMYMFAFLFASLAMLSRRKFIWASVALGLALCIKLTAWPLVPLFFYYIYLKNKDLREIGKCFGVLAVVVGIFTLPFLVWDPKAYLDSTVFFLSGNTAHSYPISGYGFASILHELGIIKNVNSYYPFSIWQVLVGLPVFVVLANYLRKNPTTKTLITTYAILLFVFWYFSRYFNNSHIGFISVVLIAAYFWPTEDKSK